MATYTGLSVNFCIPKYTLGSAAGPRGSMCSPDGRQPWPGRAGHQGRRVLKGHGAAQQPPGCCSPACGQRWGSAR